MSEIDEVAWAAKTGAIIHAAGGPCDGVPVLMDLPRFLEGDDIWLIAPDNSAPIYRLLRDGDGWTLKYVPVAGTEVMA